MREASKGRTVTDTDSYAFRLSNHITSQRQESVGTSPMPRAMGYLIDILRYSSGSIFWGFLIAVCMLALFFFLIKGWYKNAMFTPVSYLCGAVLGVLLIVQCILICGSLSILGMVDDFEAYMNQLVTPALATMGNQIATIEEGDNLTKAVIDEFPLLGHFVGGGIFKGYTMAELPSAIADECRSYFHWYIFRRIMWSLGFVTVAAVIVIKTMDFASAHKRHRSYNSDYYDYTSGDYGNGDDYSSYNY